MRLLQALFFVIVVVAFFSCTQKLDVAVNKNSVMAGTEVTMNGERLELYGGRIAVGDNLMSTIDPELADKIRGKVALLSVVPSLETKVCEAQTHALGEAKNLNDKVVRVTVSRDLPMAQERFAREAKLEHILYFSDYKSGSFGHHHGLMMKGKELLARAVIVVDQNGTIRYLQIVPEVTELPDMDAAIDVANRLAS